MAAAMSAFGIDLGTTNSCLSRFVDGAYRIVPIDGFPTVPSVVAVVGGALVVGRRALNHAMVKPGEAVRSIKRRMGETDCRVTLQGKVLSPVDVSAQILSYLKTQGEAATGETIREVVITVPAWFNDPQRRATLEAGARAGLKVLRIINEPTAAALAVSITGGEAKKAEERWLVYDLGGGTFDVSILKVTGTVKEVLASCGNTFLGGDDFDHRLALHFVDLLKDHYQVDPSQDPATMAHLKFIAEATKIKLSIEPEVEVREMLRFGEQSLELQSTVTRHDFEGMISHHVEATIGKVREALSQAHTNKTDVDRLLLVGGSTRIPLVHRMLQQELGLSPEDYVDVDLSVAFGASIQAALDSGLTLSQIVIDVAPHTLGIAVMGREDHSLPMHDSHPMTFAPILRKNTRLPARFTDEFMTMVDDQEKVEVAVYQGEAAITRENTFIGSFVSDLPSMPLNSPLYVGFEYDSSGVIHVSVAVKGRNVPLKRYTMDLGKSATLNSELVAKSSSDSDWLDAEVEDHSPAGSARVTNYLVEKVEQRLNLAPDAEIAKVLAEYRDKLSRGEDGELDELEDQLYEWVDLDAQAPETRGTP